MVHGNERTQARSEQGVAVAEPGLKLEQAAEGVSLVGGEMAAALEQRHLGGEVATFTHLHRPMDGIEAYVITTAITAGAD